MILGNVNLKQLSGTDFLKIVPSTATMSTTTPSIVVDKSHVMHPRRLKKLQGEDDDDSVSESDKEEIYVTTSGEEYDDNEEEEEHLKRLGTGRNPHKQMVQFEIQQDNGEILLCKIHGSIVANTHELEILSKKKSNFTWLVLMLGGGHFAGGIFRNGELSQTEHKTFHRYTVRRKQGGSQSAQDATGKKPKSVGSTLRRHNEKMLREEICALIQSWKQSIQECDRIFIACSRRSRGTLFQDEAVLSGKDERIRYIPFIVGRPTLDEAKRIVQKLSSIEILKPTSQEIVVEKEKEQVSLAKSPSSSSSSSPPPPPPPPTNLVVADSIFFERDIHKSITSGDDSFEKYLLDINAQNDLGETPLLIASRMNLSQTIMSLLEHGANPLIRDFRGRSPYQACSEKKSRNAFREYRGSHPDQWDYDEANIPEGITEDSEREKREKEKLKKKKQLQAKKEKKALEQEASIAEAKAKAKEEEAAAAAHSLEKCTFCSGPMPLKRKDWFTTLSFQFCSSTCQTNHRRKLMSEAAEKRLVNNI